jgi:predicted transcriptional regulator
MIMAQSAEPAGSLFDIETDAAHDAAVDAQAEADLAAGRTVEHESVRAWLEALAQGKKLPPPQR